MNVYMERVFTEAKFQWVHLAGLFECHRIRNKISNVTVCLCSQIRCIIERTAR